MIALKFYKIFDIKFYEIGICFLIWFILYYLSANGKNKENRTPKPVYLSR